MIRNKPITNHWFVSVETPKQLRLSSSAAPRPRETKSFPTEIEAKQFAIAMLSEGRKVTAGTLSPHRPKRRTITASEINQWIGEEEQRRSAKSWTRKRCGSAFMIDVIRNLAATRLGRIGSMTDFETYSSTKRPAFLPA
jgi:hypothetical protein